MSNSKEFLHGMQEYCDLIQNPDAKTFVKDVLDIVYSDDIEQSLILYMLKNIDKDEAKLFRFINDYIKKNGDYKTMSDAFSRGQMKSKIWLTEKLKAISPDWYKIVILAGWNGQLADILRHQISYRKCRIVDIDKQACWNSDYIFNIDRLEDYKVKAVCADINNLTLHSTGYEWSVENFKTGDTYVEKFNPKLIINTSAEHMTTEWFNQIRFKAWEEMPTVAIQSNNYFDLPEHINCVHSNNHMEKMFPMQEIYYSGELQLKGYKRVMLIGKPNAG